MLNQSSIKLLYNQLTVKSLTSDFDLNVMLNGLSVYKLHQVNYKLLFPYLLPLKFKNDSMINDREVLEILELNKMKLLNRYGNL